MTEDQAHGVLRQVTEHALTWIQYLYGKHHIEAAKLIQEALIVDKAAREAKTDKPPSN